jgi:hypothetical protein
MNPKTFALVAALMLSSFARAQTAPGEHPGVAQGQQASRTVLDDWGRPVSESRQAQKPAPGPRRDIFGIWDPGTGGIQALGAKAMPEDGKPEHALPYTPQGLKALNLTKPSNGVRQVAPGKTNDPVVSCDPQGMPREDLWEIRTTQIIQMPLQVIMLYEYNKIWRVVWTDGRGLPQDPEPRWFGYSVGKWEDDYTFLVETSGISEKTWIDRAGRPHSADLRVEERFHRVNHDTLELSVKITDPKMYTKPWVALDRLPFKLEPPDFDVREMICSPSELAQYNKFVGNPASDKSSQ